MTWQMLRADGSKKTQLGSEIWKYFSSNHSLFFIHLKVDLKSKSQKRPVKFLPLTQRTNLSKIGCNSFPFRWGGGLVRLVARHNKVLCTIRALQHSDQRICAESRWSHRFGVPGLPFRSQVCWADRWERQDLHLHPLPTWHSPAIRRICGLWALQSRGVPGWRRNDRLQTMCDWRLPRSTGPKCMRALHDKDHHFRSWFSFTGWLRLWAQDYWHWNRRS